MEEWPWGLQEAPPLHGWGVIYSADFACNAPYTPELNHRQCVGTAPPVGTGLTWDPAQGMVGPQTGSERAAGMGPEPWALLLCRKEAPGWGFGKLVDQIKECGA